MSTTARPTVNQQRDRRGLQMLIWTLLGAVLLTFNLSYTVDMGANHPLQIIVLQKITNPRLYPNDPFVNQTYYAYTSILWQSVVPFLMRWFSFESISTVLFAISRVLISYMAVHVAIRLLNNHPYAPLAGLFALLTIPNPFIGDGHPIRNFMEQTGFAFGLGLLAIFAITQNRGWLCAATLGGCFLFNTMYGVFACVYLLTAIVFVSNFRKNWLRWLGWIVLGILLGAAGWFPTLTVGLQPYDVEAAWKVSEIAYPWHFYMVSGRGNILFPAFVIVTLLIVRRATYLSENSRLLLAIWTGVAVFWYLIAHFFPFIVSPSQMRLHPIRGQDFWHFIAAVNLWGWVIAYLRQRVAALRVRFTDAAYYAFLLTGVLLVGITPEVIRVANGGGLYKYIHSTKSSEVHRVAAWAQANTQEDDVFIVPITLNNPWAAFRHLSKRNVYLHWKDGSGWTYAIWYSKEFLQRVRDIGFFEKNNINESNWRKGDWIFRRRVYPLQRSFVIEEADVLRIARKYRVDYWITDKNTPTRFPTVYVGETVKVVRINHKK